jgi:hypothetical protein
MGMTPGLAIGNSTPLQSYSDAARFVLRTQVMYKEKETMMNPSMDAHEYGAMARALEVSVLTEQELLAQWGFTAEEIVSQLWLTQWYQTGGSDRALMVCHLEFLRFLVRTGELEL